MINFQKITKIYYSDGRSITALKDVSFEIQPKEFVSIVGRSGAGKTTLFKMLMAEENPTDGSVIFEGEDVHQIGRSNLPHIRRKIGAIFQDYKLLSSKTAYENVAYIMEVIGVSDGEIISTVPQVLELVGLGQRAGNFPEELSGGERQRVAIARAMIHRPDVILADEPTGNLDSKSGGQVMEAIEKLHEAGHTIVLITHETYTAAFAQRIIELKDGLIEKDRVVSDRHRTFDHQFVK